MLVMKIWLAVVFVTAAPFLSAADAISSAEAKSHIGETAAVCGLVADATYQQNGSHVTFLNFDKPYPDHTFTAFLPAENREKFGAPEKEYKGKQICVTGKILEYHGKPEIILTDPQQIKLQTK